ncbi:OST-HTH/LOTUS domain-containing protein [Hydrogenophaga sp.]|uniref:OST-HTH/LOTUS domain-containing protein n=1 Tax=Hydrogenophaga sp. TaxID=1904254 RepID=UPI003D286FCA
MDEIFRPEAQHEVQRQLGRCLVRLQQYERLLKVMLSHHRLGGAAEDLQALQAENVVRFSNKTLGQLVDVLFDTFAVAEGTDRPVLDDSKVPLDKVSMSFQFQMQMEEARLAAVKAAIEELVRMRNELVHHFIERFAIWTNEGCAAALEHLSACYARIDQHVLELREWAEHMDKARAMAAAFAQSPTFHDMVVDGIAPDGSVDWAWAGIVRALKDALERNATDGWLRLEDAKSWMAQHHPEQTPERYQCRTWAQVLNDSRAFRLEYRHEGGRRVARFSSKG